jgi:hypothetical protein
VEVPIVVGNLCRRNGPGLVHELPSPLAGASECGVSWGSVGDGEGSSAGLFWKRQRRDTRTLPMRCLCQVAVLDSRFVVSYILDVLDKNAK